MKNQRHRENAKRNIQSVDTILLRIKGSRKPSLRFLKRDLFPTDLPAIFKLQRPCIRAGGSWWQGAGRGSMLTDAETAYLFPKIFYLLLNCFSRHVCEGRVHNLVARFLRMLGECVRYTASACVSWVSSMLKASIFAAHVCAHTHAHAHTHTYTHTREEAAPGAADLAPKAGPSWQ